MKARNSIKSRSRSPEKERTIHSSAKNAELVEKKRQQIVEGACQIFFEKGFHPTTIREIAQRCGMSMGQLYHYVASKDDVLFLVHEYIQETWYDHLRKPRIDEIEDPLTQLSIALRLTIEFIYENRKLFQFVYSESKYLKKEKLKIVLRNDNKNVVGFWRELLEKINKQKPIKGNLDFSANLITYLMTFLALRGWNLKGRSKKENVALSMDFILRGLGLVD